MEHESGETHCPQKLAIDLIDEENQDNTQAEKVIDKFPAAQMTQLQV